MFFNGHGGNSALLNVANRELRLHHGLMTFTTHPGVPPDQGGLSAAHESGMGVHGGHDETSLMLHIRPDLVDMSTARRSIPEHLAERRYTRFGGTVSFGWLSNDFDDCGVIGDPTQATAEHGAALFDAAVTAFAAALGESATFEFRPAGSRDERERRACVANETPRTGCRRERSGRGPACPMERLGNRRRAAVGADRRARHGWGDRRAER